MSMSKKALLLVLLAAMLNACDSGTQPDMGKAQTPEVAETGTAGILTSCANCHGQKGANGSAGVPHLAGQHPEYLLAAIRAYVIGERPHNDMREMVIALTDQQRQEVADYYAKLDTPWKGVEKVMGPVSNQKAIAAGKAIARPCTSCHGDDGASTRPGVPDLAGLRPEYFKKSLHAYLNGERKGAEIMVNFKYSLSTRDIENLATYFASLAPRQTSVLAYSNEKAGKKAAEACVGCHGANGNSINSRVPSIAGQNGPYLVKSLLNYRSRERKEPIMQKAVAKLGDQTINDLAAYYSRQKPESLASGVSSKPGVFDPLGDGAVLAASCDGCHGKNVSGKQSGVPRLMGLNAHYLMSALSAYKSGARDNDTMKMFVDTMSDLAMEKVSFFYANQEPTANQRKAKGDAAAGEKISSGCAGCHGERGVSSDPKVPSLAGQDAEYLVGAILGYASKQRPVEAMTDAVKELSRVSAQNVAAYYATQSPSKPELRLPEAPEQWAVKCGRCHGEAGHATQADKPRLAGQIQSYITNALLEYRSGKRVHSTMNAMAEDLSLSEITALAEYYARQQ